MTNIKHNQHYVFQAYLKAWQNDNGQVCCLRNREKLFHVDTKNINLQRDFYSVKPIGLYEKEFYDLFYSKITKENKKILDLYIYELIYVHNMANSTGKLVDSVKSNQKLSEIIGESSIQNLERLGKKCKNDFIEDYMCDIETDLITYIKHLINNDKTFYYNIYDKIDESNKKYGFLYNLTMQYFRTKKMRNKIKATFDDIKKEALSNSKSKFRDIILHADIDALFPIFMIANSALTALAMYKKGMDLKILTNTANHGFITGDQPVVNLKADYKNTDAPAELEFYYPISPKKAIIIGEELSMYPEEIRDINLIQSFNNKIAEASEENLISKDKRELQSYIVNSI